jgi:hypothetical protein
MAGFNQQYSPYQFGGYGTMNQSFPMSNNFGGQQSFNNMNNGITWVQGIEGAKAYQLNPNSNVILLDSESDKFYIKTSDNIGMCNLRVFEFTEITNNPQAVQKQPEIDMSNYVTKSEFEDALKNINGGRNNGKQYISSNEQSKSNAK